MTRPRLRLADHVYQVNPAIEEAHQRADAEELVTLSVSALGVSPWQPRLSIPLDEEFQALVESVAEHGVLEPLLVREVAGGHELLAGERRLRAARAAGLSHVPVRILRGLDDCTARAVALTENLARADLTPFEESRALVALAEVYGAAGRPSSVRALAAATGRSKSAVDRALGVGRACTDELWCAAFGGTSVPAWDTLTLVTLEAIARSPSAEARWELLRAAVPVSDGQGAAAGDVGAPNPAAVGARRGPLAARPRVEVSGDLARGRWAVKLRAPVSDLEAGELRHLLDTLEPLVAALRHRIV